MSTVTIYRITDVKVDRSMLLEDVVDFHHSLSSPEWSLLVRLTCSDLKDMTWVVPRSQRPTIVLDNVLLATTVTLYSLSTSSKMAAETNGHSSDLITGLAHVNLLIPPGSLEKAHAFYG